MATLQDQANELMRQRREAYEAYAKAHQAHVASEHTRTFRALDLFHNVIPRLKGELLAAQRELDACGYVKSLDFGD